MDPFSQDSQYPVTDPSDSGKKYSIPKLCEYNRKKYITQFNKGQDLQ